MALSRKQKGLLPEIVEALDTIHLLRWEQINSIIVIDDVIDFCNDLIEFGNKYGLRHLLQYAENLKDCTESYEVDKIKSNLKVFPEYLEKLRGMIKK